MAARIGADADPQNTSVTPDGTLTVSFEPVPEFFIALGVGEPPNISSQIDDLGIVEQVSGAVDAVAGEAAAPFLRSRALSGSFRHRHAMDAGRGDRRHVHAVQRHLSDPAQHARARLHPHNPEI